MFLKEKTANKIGVEDISTMRLLFGTKELTEAFDQKTLADVGIEDESTVYVVFRVKGGVNIEIIVKLY